MSPSTSEPTEGLTIEGLTTFDPTLSPSYVPTGPDKDSLVTSKPTSKPSSKPTKAPLTDEPTLNPSYAPTNSVTDAPVMGKPTTPSTPNSTTTVRFFIENCNVNTGKRFAQSCPCNLVPYC